MEKKDGFIAAILAVVVVAGMGQAIVQVLHQIAYYGLIAAFGVLMAASAVYVCYLVIGMFTKGPSVLAQYGDKVSHEDILAALPH